MFMDIPPYMKVARKDDGPVSLSVEDAKVRQQREMWGEQTHRKSSTKYKSLIHMTKALSVPTSPTTSSASQKATSPSSASSASATAPPSNPPQPPTRPPTLASNS
jgi:hypothetical protein